MRSGRRRTRWTCRASRRRSPPPVASRRPSPAAPPTRFATRSGSGAALRLPTWPRAVHGLGHPRLEELRLAVIEERIDLDLRAGGTRRSWPSSAISSPGHPFRERFVGQLMLALYRTGRQAEALDVFRRNRDLLADELGIEPGPDLQQLQLAVLRQDPSLDATVPVEATRPTVGREPAPDEQADAPATVAPRSSRRRARAPVRLGALLLVASMVGVALLAYSGRLAAAPSRAGDEAQAPVAAPDSVAVFDPVANELVDDIPAGHAPGPVAAMDGNLWVGSGDDHTISQIDLVSHRVVHTNGLAGAPSNLVAADGSVWIANGFSGTLSRILTAYDQLSAPFYPDKTVAGLLAIAASNGDLWVGLSDETLLRMDASSLHVELTATVPDRVQAITTSDDAAWTIQFKDRLVRRIDRANGTVGPGISVDGTPTAIAFGDGSVWVATGGQDRVWRIDPSPGGGRRLIPARVHAQRARRRREQRLGGRRRRRRARAARPVGSGAPDRRHHRPARGRRRARRRQALADDPLTRTADCTRLRAQRARLRQNFVREPERSPGRRLPRHTARRTGRRAGRGGRLGLERRDAASSRPAAEARRLLRVHRVRRAACGVPGCRRKDVVIDLIARLPIPKAGRELLEVASEVAEGLPARLTYQVVADIGERPADLN